MGFSRRLSRPTVGVVVRGAIEIRISVARGESSHPCTSLGRFDRVLVDGVAYRDSRAFVQNVEIRNSSSCNRFSMESTIPCLATCFARFLWTVT